MKNFSMTSSIKSLLLTLAVTLFAVEAMAGPGKTMPEPDPAVIATILRNGQTVDTIASSTCDSLFAANSRPVIFTVNKTYLTPEERKWMVDSLKPALDALGENGMVLARAAASPEGPWDNNQRLAIGRRNAAISYLTSIGVDYHRIKFDVVTEDYDLLVAMMQTNNDPEYQRVRDMVKAYGTNYSGLKNAMKKADKGRLWQRLLKQYYPELRAVRFMLFDRRDNQKKMPEQVTEMIKVPTALPTVADLFPTNFEKPELPFKVHIQSPEPRREAWSVKTNLLEYGAVIPRYGYCPIPNVAVEYYPLHGHFTYGASLDCPWWQNYWGHKYFQVRNYQLETRYYFRSGDINSNPPGQGAAFRGWYLQGYGHFGLFGICLDADHGYEGEGIGAGLGFGYVLPLTKNGHWKLEFSAQAGYIWTKYDPYQWQCPTDPEVENDKYFYKTYLTEDEYKKRQHRFTWLGPTRVGITLTYDILYRRNHKKGLSFKSWEKGGSR